MGAHRDLAVEALKALTLKSKRENDFMYQADILMPEVLVPGALPAMGREEFGAIKLHKHLDAVVVFTIGDYPNGIDCSSYYDPDSPWYNVFYGAYGLRSYKADGSAWGYHPDGSPNIDEFLEFAAADYNFLTAGHLGCPPDKMSFRKVNAIVNRKQGW